MTDISATDRVTALTGAEKIPVLQGGTFKHLTPLDLGGLRLSADLNIYVATTGNDVTGTGAVGAPFASLNRAYQWVSASVDFAGFVVYVNIADGSYDALVISANHITGGTICFIGNTADPTAVSIVGQFEGNTNSCISISGGGFPTTTHFVGVTLDATAFKEYDSVYVDGPHTVIFGSAPDNRNAATEFIGTPYGLASAYNGAKLTISGNLNLDDLDLNYVVYASNAEVRVLSFNAMVMASLNITEAFLLGFSRAYIDAIIGVNIQTTVTGKKYTIEEQSLLIDVVGGIPGDVTGTTDTGGLAV